ncbi:hypothetical protein BGZ83_001315 [Gryganskiella cystojenkinii]|nr:hypothetical protein BGZ83_001315 [Gryganskiella cystojenkinii]
MPFVGPVTAAVAAVLSLGVAAHQFIENRVMGTLSDIHTSDTVYNRAQFGHILDYDAYSMIIHGQRTLILSGEFHYWRLPDKNRWKPILEQYRSAGLNCIRIYFHWGFHSPAKGKYIFDGNRDIEYLLHLCEELGLYVLAAPGPYICAETQAGGFPIWLASQRDIRLRHMKTNFWKVYDPKFMEACIEYFEHILPILARHQITNSLFDKKKEGCVLALQIENESFQKVFGYPIGLHDDMRVLSKTARDCGITVPLFTNDGFEEGSFIVKEDPRRAKKDFGVDMYGFDKYVVFTPNSEPTSWLVSRDPASIDDWEPRTVMSELDSMEKKVRSFGHANLKTPIFIPELQGGWFNHYGIKYDYDTIYSFYGEKYTRLMLDTVFSQGCTMLNFYMFYGGTNWGTIGDADVYTSYDYSASIREYGLMSGRLRTLRLGLLFLQSFSDIMVRTDAVKSARYHTVKSSVHNTICQQRLSKATTYRSGSVELTFIRNFSHKRVDTFELSACTIRAGESAHNNKNRRGVTRLSCYAPYKSSFIALGNYTTLNRDIHLVLSATPIHIRGYSNADHKGQHYQAKSEVWIAALAGVGPTEMAFEGPLVIKASGGRNLKPGSIKLRPSQGDRGVSILSIPEFAKDAFVVLASDKQKASDPVLHIIFLDQKELSTLYCYYDNRHARHRPDVRHSAIDASMMAAAPKIVTWGSYNALYDPEQKTLTVDATDLQKEIRILSFGEEKIVPVNEQSEFGPGLALQTIPLTEPQTVLEETRESYAGWVRRNKDGLALQKWQTRTTNFSAFDWKDCPRKYPNSPLFKNVNLDYHFTSGHILYRGEFKTTNWHRLFGGTIPASDAKAPPVRIKINSRHRVIAYVNGVCIGSHMTYSRQLLMPGAKMGYDPISFGTHEFEITPQALAAAEDRIACQSDAYHHDHELHRHHSSDHSRPSSQGAPVKKPHSSDQQVHEIILVIDSFGLSRQPFVVDDIRNPRGLLSAKVEGKTVVDGSESWKVAGVDVRELSMAYQSTGFPDEHETKHWRSTNELPCIVPNRGVTWWRTNFEGPPASASSSRPNSSSSARGKQKERQEEETGITTNVPLCLRIHGEFSAMIILNNVLVGRYFGSDSPQNKFYLMDGLVHKAGFGRMNELKLMMYGSKASVSTSPAGVNSNTVQIQIQPWIVEDAQGELGHWSGNAMFEAYEKGEAQATVAKAGPFWTMRQSFGIGGEM